MSLVLCFLLAFGAAPQFQTLIEEGLAALENKDLAAARRDFEQAMALAPTSAPAWFLLARIYAESDDLTAALAAARKSSEFAGSDATILYNLAVFYHRAGETDLSIAAGERALSIEDSADIRTLLGNAHAAKGDWPMAIPHYEETRRLSPYSDEVLFDLAQAHLRRQDFPSAIAVLEEGRKTFDQVPQL